MRAILVLLTAVLVGAPTLAATRDELFPRPPELVPRVEFWTRIYTEVGTDGGLLHDPDQMDVVYEVMRFPGASPRSRDRKVQAAKKRYAAILLRLARGGRSRLSEEEKRVLALWPEGVADSSLEQAARRVRFQLGQADKFRDGIVRSGAWEGYIHGVLDEHGIPRDLGVLPHVESSFNLEAHSHAGASGIWQFTRSTGRRFLRVDHVVDERLDPMLSTVAAARLLRENYETTQSWPLAITAYNHGAAGMSRAVRKLGTRDIGAIVENYQSRSFGFASRNFYAEFLAALHVTENHTHYFGPLQRDLPVNPEIVVLDHHYAAETLARAFGLPVVALRTANPALLEPVWQGQKYVPARYGLRLPGEPSRSPAAVILASIDPAQRFAVQKPDRHYRVRRGDSLSRIASRFGVRESELVALNGLRSRHRIRAGQLLRLPVPGDSTQLARETTPPDGRYRVRPGDSLSRIARRFGTSESQLVALNDLERPDRIHVGQVLLVTGTPAPEASGGEPAPDEQSIYQVRRGDTLSSIARRHGVSVNDLAAANRLRNRHRLEVGQTLVLPLGRDSAPPARAEAAAETVASAPEALATQTPTAPAQAADAEEGATGRAGAPSPTVAAISPDLAEAQAAPAAPPPGPATQVGSASPSPAEGGMLDSTEPPTVGAGLPWDAREPAPRAALPVELDPARFAVDADGAVRVQPEETLGHYADWLEIPTSRLRRRNGFEPGVPLSLGSRVELDFARVAKPQFEERRLAYHREVLERFFREHRVAGTLDYVLQRGDTLWALSRQKLAVPVWLLSAYNPEVDFAEPLREGQRIRVPRLEPRGDA